MIFAPIAAATLLQAAPALYVADGSEPFWSLEIGGERLEYRRDGEPLVIVLPAPRATASGYRYETREIVVDIRHEDCTDEAARIRADSVTVIVGDETVQGCGGETVGWEGEPPEDGE